MQIQQVHSLLLLKYMGHLYLGPSLPEGRLAQHSQAASYALPIFPETELQEVH